MAGRVGKDIEWTAVEPDGKVPTWERVGISVMMDIRDELQRLNRILACPNFMGIPHTLKRISRNTAKPRKTARRAR